MCCIIKTFSLRLTNKTLNEPWLTLRVFVSPFCTWDSVHDRFTVSTSLSHESIPTIPFLLLTGPVYLSVCLLACLPARSRPPLPDLTASCLLRGVCALPHITARRMPNCLKQIRVMVWNLAGWEEHDAVTYVIACAGIYTHTSESYVTDVYLGRCSRCGAKMKKWKGRHKDMCGCMQTCIYVFVKK